jgi:hypothetical protein
MQEAWLTSNAKVITATGWFQWDLLPLDFQLITSVWREVFGFGRILSSSTQSRLCQPGLALHSEWVLGAMLTEELKGLQPPRTKQLSVLHVVRLLFHRRTAIKKDYIFGSLGLLTEHA